MDTWSPTSNVSCLIIMPDDNDNNNNNNNNRSAPRLPLARAPLVRRGLVTGALYGYAPSVPIERGDV